VRVGYKEIKGKKYYVLEHSERYGKKVVKKEKYLGVQIPSNIEKLKDEFIREIVEEKYLDKFDEIKKNFSHEFKIMPISARKKYLDYFMIKFTYNSNRIEGNTITLKETAKILEDNICPKNKPLDDVKEIEAHKKVFYEVVRYDKDLSLNVVLKWHYLMLKDTQKDIAGKIRKHQIKVARSKAEFTSPVEIEPCLRDFFKWYNKEKKDMDVVELAALVHLKFVSIHPFCDGNGRMSRLLMNFVLNKHNYPMLNIKYSNRDSYYNALERSQVKREDFIFVRHLFKRYLKEYEKYH
jgi:Fic family protein